MPRKGVKIAAQMCGVLLVLAGVACGGGGGQEPTPTQVQARHENSLGVVAMDQHNYVLGRAHFETARELDPAYATAYTNLGISLYSLGKYDSARVALERALELEPEHLHASYTLGLIDHAQGLDYDRALRLFRTVAEQDPDDPLVRYYLGRTYAKLGHVDSALAAYRRTIDLDPANVSAYYAMAQEQRQAGDREAWRATLETFNRLSQAGVEGVSAAYQGQGKYAEALADGAFGQQSDAARSATVDFAPVVPLGGLPASPAYLTLTDADGDGLVDVLTGDGQTPPTLLRGLGDGSLQPASNWTFPPGAAATTRLADLDGDGDVDAVLTGAATRVALQDSGGTFRPAGTPPGACDDVVFGDADHDGDTDVVCLGQALRYWANDGTAQFADGTQAAGLGPHPARDALFSDVDSDRDVDILTRSADGVALYGNNRDGTFTDVAGERGLRGARRAIAVGDLVADGWMDLALAGAGGLELFTGHGRRFAARALPAPEAIWGLVPADLDNDGDLDLLIHGGSGVHPLLASDGEFTLQAALTTRATAQLAAADLDADGRVDVLTSEGRFGNRSEAGGHLEIALRGLNSNPDGFGARVEVLTPTSRQVREYRHGDSPALHIGLGEADKAEFVRLLWPSGVRQTELDTAAGTRLEITEVNRKGTSCPILYAWDGERFRFVSDFLGGAIIGYLTAPGQYNTPDTDELLPIPHLAPTAQGRFVLQIGNQLEEVIYLDAAELVAVDHPAGTAWVPDERLLSAPPYPSVGGFVLSASRPLRGAYDGQGLDVSADLAAIDDVWHDGFEHEDIHGYARPHELILDLGDLAGWDHPVLLAHGWVDYAHSTSNWAAGQRGLALTPPRLEARQGDGPWRLVTADMGTPAGLPKGMLVDLQGVFAADAGAAQLRITTNVAVYWDHFRLARAAPEAPRRMHRRPFAAADLHWRGYPVHEAIHGTFAFRYDYDTVRADAGWGTHGGAFTRYGEVGPLVADVDDRFAILFHGDELTLEVEADAFPPLEPGWQRSWLFYSDGFGKDMDLHSAHSLTVEPLPFHGMSRYPYGPEEAYPATPEHVEYVLEYNTRWVKGYYR